MAENKWASKTDVDIVSKQVGDLNKTMIGVVLVLFLGFITLLVSFITLVLEASGTRTEATNQLRDEIRLLNERLPSQEEETIISMPKDK